MNKTEFKKIIKTAGFSSQGKFAELIGIKANTFTTYKKIPGHVARIAKLSLLARDNGVSIDEIKAHLKLDRAIESALIEEDDENNNCEELSQ
ncbi:MAG: hypothetical protein ACNI3C_03835 [Candidatus Marinarcus sp.]|uniref:hypothetical protein n=1 Tax=Candidatus Marinarcus sp. TaxID=3100987 RepID=UPI003AFF9BFF